MAIAPHFCYSSPGEAETKESLGLESSQFSQIGKRSERESLSENRRCSKFEKIFNVDNCVCSQHTQI